MGNAPFPLRLPTTILVAGLIKNLFHPLSEQAGTKQHREFTVLPDAGSFPIVLRALTTVQNVTRLRVDTTGSSRQRTGATGQEHTSP